jgi:Flp pilus assembly protein TadG
MPATSLMRNRNGAVSVMFAAAVVPMIGLLGLAVDYGIWNQTNATLSVAANVAAMTAVKIAANAQLAGDPNALTEGKEAGQQWFNSEVGYNNRIGVNGVTLNGTGASGASVTVTGGATVTAQVSYSGTVPSIFGNIFAKIKTYNINGTATAIVQSAPYLNVEMLLDNSSSMDIGATTNDMVTLMQLSACDPSNAAYNGATEGASQDYYGNYAYSYNGVAYGGNYTPAPMPPILALNPTTGYTAPMAQNANVMGKPGPSCKGFLPAQPDGSYPLAGPPCAFACHWTNVNSGLSNDLYGMARRTIGTQYQVTLRFDLVKNATNQVISTMQSDNLAINNLNVGIYTFNKSVTQVYPTDGTEAGGNWAAAAAAVGTPPQTSTAAETGIQPTVGGLSGNNDDTAFVQSMATLQSQYLPTPSGDGTTAATPRKVLFIVTDGFLDDPNTGERNAFPYSACAGFKNLGYTIYVVYTPYYPVMHIAYITNNWNTIVSGTGTTSISYNLQQCASSSSDYISAADGPSLYTALQGFLKAALNTPARFTM